MIADQTVLSQHPDVATRTVDGRAVAIRPPLPNEPPALFTFNETGTVIWDLVDGRTSISALLEHLATLYPEMPAERRKTETLALLEQLVKVGMLMVSQEMTP